MSLGSPGLGPKKNTGLLSRFRKNNKKDLKKLVKDSGDPVYQGYLKKYKEKEAEWKSRWVEIRGGYIMWTSSKGGGRGDYKDYIDLKGARLIDEASMNGLDALEKPVRAAPVVYSVEKGKTRNLGTLKEKSALSREYSWRVVPRNGPSHIFAAEGDDQKEEWWKNILKCIHQSPGTVGLSNNKLHGRPVLEDIPLFSGDKPVSITKQQVEFDFLSVVGRGAYGRVIKVREKATGNIYVCKVLEKQAIIKHRMLKEVAKEQALLQKVDHPNIVDLISAFQTRDKIFLVMEFLSGGELFYHMTNEKSKRFGTDRSRFYAAQLVLAVEYLHLLKIIHCDLKAENCVLTRDGYMKLTDFGFATTTHANEKIISRNGTPVYMAPEMIRVDRDVGYSYPVDVWSLGVLIYAMLTGYFPFHGETPAITLRYVCERELAFPPDVVLTDDARDLLERCLDKNPKTRITCTQMKSHRFFNPINWDDLLHKRIPAPYVPDVTGSNTRYFPTTYESTRDTQIDAMVSVHSVHGRDPVFSGFPFVRSSSTTESQVLGNGTVIQTDKTTDEAYMENLCNPIATPQKQPLQASPPPRLNLPDSHASPSRR